MNKKHLIIQIFISLILAAFILIGLFSLKIYFEIKNESQNFYQSIDNEKSIYLQKLSIDNTLNKEATKDANNENTITFLLLGVDARQGGFGRSDTILIGKYNAKTNKIVLISVPRDSYMSVPDHGETKVNHAYAYGKEALIEVTLEQYFNIKFDYYLSINFEGFRQLIDAIGGIEVTVPHDMYWSDSSDGPNTMINLKKGTQVLNGHDALGFARFRHDAQGDWGRMDRQQEAIKAVINSIKKPENIMNIENLISIVGKNFKTDVPNSEISSFIANFIKNPNLDIESLTVKGEGKISKNDGVYYLHIYNDELEKVKEILNNI